MQKLFKGIPSTALLPMFLYVIGTYFLCLLKTHMITTFEMYEKLMLITLKIKNDENAFHLKVISKIVAKNPLKLTNLSFLT